MSPSSTTWTRCPPAVAAANASRARAADQPEPVEDECRPVGSRAAADVWCDGVGEETRGIAVTHPYRQDAELLRFDRGRSRLHHASIDRLPLGERPHLLAVPSRDAHHGQHCRRVDLLELEVRIGAGEVVLPPGGEEDVALAEVLGDAVGHRLDDVALLTRVGERDEESVRNLERHHRRGTLARTAIVADAWVAWLNIERHDAQLGDLTRPMSTPRLR